MNLTLASGVFSVPILKVTYANATLTFSSCQASSFQYPKGRFTGSWVQLLLGLIIQFSDLGFLMLSAEKLYEK